ncbi:flavin-dependent oxidoreductase [Pikeienuella piscinae]|uniref:Flavin-dependent oxidoreductase n=1 Tax=Pikeienuella piscinae TaxID=2748098 RepID=A0A7L5BXM5_9RHOB|nr:flavin-dependent oxidoreductase [Pikeienuella piscinae]QIE55893.1 flavin-dependent oxidoreductase [Pikeienuella piscinae]
MTILISGAGIGGLTLALTCHQIGLPCRLVEQAREVKPLGVGINLQPNAVRELIALGLGPPLERIGVRTAELTMVAANGREVWREPRGLDAGYRWPQYSVHRGELQMLLYRTVLERLGADAIETGLKGRAFRTEGGEAVLETDAGERRGGVLIGADGLHSTVRARMHPDEGPPIWAGAILWRGATRARPFAETNTMAMIGDYSQKFVTYPISGPDERGEVLINWIAERAFDPTHGWAREDWRREAPATDFIDWFRDWRFDWIDIPALIRGAKAIFEYPMVDRDPLPFWTTGRVTLIGDAAHIMYPTGSNGASQAIVDARRLGRAFLDHGVGPAALRDYEAEMRPRMAKVIAANRGAGPDYVLEIVKQRSGGAFDDIEAVMPLEERRALAAEYKKTAGFSVEALNAAPPLIPPGRRAMDA